MEQNTEDWLKLRHTKLGASDANVIMNVSKYKKRSELLLEKQTPYDELTKLLGNKDAGPIAALGHVIEEMERPRFELLNDVKIPATVKVSDDLNYIMASYDGLSEDETIGWEHKLMGKDMFEQVEQNICPKEYYPQIQQQLYVSPKLKGIHLCAVKYEKEMLKGKPNPANFVRAKMFVERDEVFIEKLLKENKKFWEEVLAKKDWSHLIKISRRRAKMKNLISALEKKVKEIDPIIIQNLTEVGGFLSTRSFGFKYGKQSRVSLDQDKMVLDGIDLSKYQTTNEYYVLKVTEKK